MADQDMMVFGFFSTAGLKILCKVSTEEGITACDSMMEATEELISTRIDRSRQQFNEMLKQTLVEKLMEALDHFAPENAPKAAAAAYCLAKLDAPTEHDFDETRFLLVTRAGDDLTISAYAHEDRFKTAIAKFTDFSLVRPPTETLH